MPPINRRLLSSPFAGKTPTVTLERTVTGDIELDRARDLRRTATPAERVLWLQLRALKRQGHHFRRQPPIGPYFADFACRSAKLVIELDGSHHGDARQMQYDEARTVYLNTRGYRVLRFANHEVLKERDRVMEVILRHLTPTRSASRFDLPARGR